MVVEMPSVYNLRLGALPVLANPVAHLLGDEHPELVRALCESRDPTLREVVALVTGTEPRTNATRRLIEERVGLWRRASEVLADLVATAAVGPSYVYAAARFTIGTLSEFTGQPTSSTVSPPFPGRVRLCLAFLRAMGHQAPFSSEYLEVPNSALDSNLCAAIARLVKEPFAGDEQLEVSHDSLRAGRIASSRPVEIVGALWRAVVRKSGYLNEMAALLSVIGNG
jgi:hypothetical protein